MAGTTEIVLSLERYNELIKIEEKYLQYKKFMFDNTASNKFATAMVMLEHKNLWEIDKEMNRREEE